MRVLLGKDTGKGYVASLIFKPLQPLPPELWWQRAEYIGPANRQAHTTVYICADQ